MRIPAGRHAATAVEAPRARRSPADEPRFAEAVASLLAQAAPARPEPPLKRPELLAHAEGSPDPEEEPTADGGGATRAERAVDRSAEIDLAQLKGGRDTTTASGALESLLVSLEPPAVAGTLVELTGVATSPEKEGGSPKPPSPARPVSPSSAPLPGRAEPCDDPDAPETRRIRRPSGTTAGDARPRPPRPPTELSSAAPLPSARSAEAQWLEASVVPRAVGQPLASFPAAPRASLPLDRPPVVLMGELDAPDTHYWVELPATDRAVVHLADSELGQLRIEVVKDGGGALDVEMLGDSLRTSIALRDIEADLRESFRARGAELKRLRVRTRTRRQSEEEE